MEIYNNFEVIKVVHDSGLETAIKDTGCDIDRNKTAIFISSSYGCIVGCKFCYLSQKNITYHKCNYVDIIKTVIDIKDLLLNKSDRYLKLSFMGMGDAFTLCEGLLKDIGGSTLHCLLPLFKGLDGVDIGTAWPHTKLINKNIIDEIEYLNKRLSLEKKIFNPQIDYTNRSIVRLFISLHSTIESTRNNLIPNSMPINYILRKVNKINVNVIFHYMFLEGINDTDEEIFNLIRLFKTKLRGYQLRILRYNKCNLSQYNETNKDRFNKIIKILVNEGIDIKVQISPGSEISAACGQFLCRYA